jgi:glutathione S-transferase
MRLRARHNGRMYTLYYWPGIQGRGEYVRLALEEGAARYVDVALVPPDQGGGVPAMQAILDDATLAHPPFAPPFLRAGRLLIAQTANILLYLGERLELAPRDTAGRLWAHQLQLTIADFLVEIHDTHHPIASGLYYRQQKAAARRRASDFRENRLPKYLDYFERVLERSGGRWLAGRRVGYVDLSLAQVIAGLQYAFPRAARTGLARCPRLVVLHERVFARPRIARYVASARRVAFNDDDLFRRYAELDG